MLIQFNNLYIYFNFYESISPLGKIYLYFIEFIFIKVVDSLVAQLYEKNGYFFIVHVIRIKNFE